MDSDHRINDAERPRCILACTRQQCHKARVTPQHVHIDQRVHIVEYENRL